MQSAKVKGHWHCATLVIMKLLERSWLEGRSLHASARNHANWSWTRVSMQWWKFLHQYCESSLIQTPVGHSKQGVLISSWWTNMAFECRAYLVLFWGSWITVRTCIYILTIWNALHLSDSQCPQLSQFLTTKLLLQELTQSMVLRKRRSTSGTF